MEVSTLLYTVAQNPLFDRTLTHLSQDPTVSDGETSSGFAFLFYSYEVLAVLGCRPGKRMTVCIYLCVRICVSAASCSSGRSCRTGRRRTCRCLSFSSSSSEGPSLSRSAPPQWIRPLSPASPPGGKDKSHMLVGIQTDVFLFDL